MHRLALLLRAPQTTLRILMLLDHRSFIALDLARKSCYFSLLFVPDYTYDPLYALHGMENTGIPKIMPRFELDSNSFGMKRGCS